MVNLVTKFGVASDDEVRKPESPEEIPSSGTPTKLKNLDTFVR